MAKILIVEPVGGHLASFGAELLRAGMGVQQTSCGVTAMEALRAEHFDTVVLWDQLPVLSVVDCLELLKTLPGGAPPVLVVGTSPERKLECFRLGCDDFAELPKDEPELLFRLYNLLRRSSVRSSAALSGSLADISLVDVIQMLSAARKSGRLAIDVADAEGFLLFDDGQIIHAMKAEREGEEALLGMLRVTREGGSFRFEALDLIPAAPRTIEKRTDHLLLALAGRLDEES
ncbi:MAG: response regulator [Bdellovibrionales bacterium]|nr:response regulator [Bdellovibrionales bacterium]